MDMPETAFAPTDSLAAGIYANWAMILPFSPPPGLYMSARIGLGISTNRRFLQSRFPAGALGGDRAAVGSAFAPGETHWQSDISEWGYRRMDSAVARICSEAESGSCRVQNRRAPPLSAPYEPGFRSASPDEMVSSLFLITASKRQDGADTNHPNRKRGDHERD